MEFIKYFAIVFALSFLYLENVQANESSSSCPSTDFVRNHWSDFSASTVVFYAKRSFQLAKYNRGNSGETCPLVQASDAVSPTFYQIYEEACYYQFKCEELSATRIVIGRLR